MKRTFLFLVLLTTGCRDAPDRYTAPEAFDSISPADAGRLTWNVWEDHSPAWNGTSDSVYYGARSYPGFTATGGLLLKVPRTAGRAQLLLESLQHAVTPQPWLAAPAVSPNKQSLAFVELTEVYDPTALCNAGVVCPGVAGPPAPPPDSGAANALLIRGVLRVRPLSGNGSSASLPIAFQGNSGTQRIAYPFQRQFERSGAEVFRPSWSPDGTRLVYSDGLQLLIWTVGSASAVPIPNTQDGVWPAWSPTGNVIAFTKLLRNGSLNLSCDCMRIGRPLPVEAVNRTIYRDGGTRTGTLMTINPDGTNARTLGVGEAPAWTPNGQFLIFQRSDQLWRSAPDGSAATPLPNTDYAYEPAVSPDGRWLVYSRDQKQGDRTNNMDKPFDLWTVSFQ
jgi:hypothetical protein